MSQCDRRSLYHSGYLAKMKQQELAELKEEEKSSVILTCFLLITSPIGLILFCLFCYWIYSKFGG